MQVSKWGNSLAIRLPKKLVDEMKLEAGDELTVIETHANVIVVAKNDRKAAVMEALDKFRFELPADYKFNRDEANER